MAKKVLAAGIVRYLEFDSSKEMYLYIGHLRHKKMQHKCIECATLENGHARLMIVTAYNNSPMIDHNGGIYEQTN